MKSRRTVLVIDARSTIRHVVRQAISSVDCRVEGFESAEEFLSHQCSAEPIQARLPEPACVEVELELPGMNGLELQQCLRGRHFSVPLIFVAAPGEVGAAVLATKRGALDFLEKPLEIDELTRAIYSGWAKDEQCRAECDRKRETASRLAALTQREHQVLEGLLGREPPKRIAASLGTSPHTVRNQRASILRKMGAQDDAELLSMVLLSGSGGSGGVFGDQ